MRKVSILREKKWPEWPDIGEASRYIAYEALRKAGSEEEDQVGLMDEPKLTYWSRNN